MFKSIIDRLLKGFIAGVLADFIPQVEQLAEDAYYEAVLNGAPLPSRNILERGLRAWMATALDPVARKLVESGQPASQIERFRTIMEDQITVAFHTKLDDVARHHAEQIAATEHSHAVH